MVIRAQVVVYPKFVGLYNLGIKGKLSFRIVAKGAVVPTKAVFCLLTALAHKRSYAWVFGKACAIILVAYHIPVADTVC